MIVDQGKLPLLNAQAPFLATCKWGLFTNNLTPIQTTVFTDLVEAAFGGYSRLTVGPMNAAFFVSPRAFMQPVTQPSWTNTSGLAQQIYGWFLADPGGALLIAAVNVGPVIIGPGLVYALSQSITDNEE